MLLLIGGLVVALVIALGVVAFHLAGGN